MKFIIPNREKWVEEEGKALLQGELWFTDGSKGEGWAGTGLYDSAGKRGLAIPLGQYSFPGGSFRHPPLRGNANK